MTTAATDVLAMLRRHYLPEGRPASGIFAAEIQAPDSARRGDLIWAPLVPSAGKGLVGHEVKVSRSDVLAELADPMKCEAWAQFCTYWWLVVADPALVEGLDIPETWGIMAPPSGRRTRSMTVLRPAPLRKVHDTGPAWRRITSWYHHHVGVEVPRLETRLKYKGEEVVRLQQQLHDASRGQPRSVPRDEELVRGVLERLRSDAGSGRHRGEPADVPTIGSWEMPDAQQIVDAILDVERSRKLASEARRAADRTLRVLENLAGDTQRLSEQLRNVEEIASGELPGAE